MHRSPVQDPANANFAVNTIRERDLLPAVRQPLAVSLALSGARGGIGVQILSTRYAPTSTRASGVADLASGGYCASAVAKLPCTARTEHAMPFASCHEAAAARCCAQLLGPSSRGCRYREYPGPACPTHPVDGYGGCNGRIYSSIWPSCSPQSLR